MNDNIKEKLKFRIAISFVLDNICFISRSVDIWRKK